MKHEEDEEVLPIEKSDNGKKEHQLVRMEDIILNCIQTLFTQYIELFEKAKIFQIKKLFKLKKQIQNYTNGFIQK